MKNFYLVIVICLLVIQNVNSQSETKSLPKRIYTTKSVTKAPIIDGVLDDASWNAVEWATNFTEKQPDEGSEPTYQTKFKIVYDAKYLYIAIRALDDEPDLVQRRLTRRDGFAGDRVNVIIDSYHDKRTAFVFTTTAAGVKGEEIATGNGNNWDESWNPIWYTKVTHDDKGWNTEMKIPLSQLRFGKSKEQIWGLNIVRNIFRKNERSLWQRIPNSQSGFISEAGELHGLIDLKSQKQLEIQPFTVLKYDSYPKEGVNPFRDGNDFKANFGLDAKIGITNDLTLDLTINPDFGQVEADPGNIVLDGFNDVFFREQRPFFVENKNIFDFEFANGRDNLFYSRRIGRSPRGNTTRGNNEFEDYPNETSILGAAKFSGKTKNGWSIGFLESITANEYATIRNVNGNEREEIVEPLTNYFVARVQKDFNKRNSFIGGIFTATNRNLADKFNKLHKAAYTGGVDFNHNWHNRNYFLDGNVIFSHVQGSKEAITATQQHLRHNFNRVDATHLNVDVNKTSLSGSGGRIEAGKSGGGNWRYNVGFIWRSPELELNDVGFLRQTDEKIQFANLRYLWQKPTNTYRNIEARLSQFSTYDFEGNHNKTQYELKGNISWKNNWWTEVGFGHIPLVYGNAFLRGGPRWRFADENFMFLFFGSDQSKKFNFTLGYVDSKTEENVNNFNEYVFRMNYQPFDALSLSLNTTLRSSNNKTQYVTQLENNGTKRYILGEIDNQTLSTTLRLNYSVNPNLSIQYYGQPFISRGRYSNFNFVNNPTASSLKDRVNWYDNNQITAAVDSKGNDIYNIDENKDAVADYSIGKPDFSFVQFRSNLVVRWEYIPGSELFFVWSQGITGNANVGDSLRDGLRNQILNQPKENTFLIKATYRFY